MAVRSGHSRILEWSTCLRPGCAKRIKFNAGNPPLYCGPRCRVQAARDQRFLREQVARIDSVLARQPEPAEREALLRRRRVALWHLARYAPAAIDPESMLD